MKKFILGLLLSVPALSYCAGTTTVGGFEFPTEDAEDTGDGMVMVNRSSADGAKWFGYYRGGKFALYTKAQGRSRIWFMMSSKRGDKLYHSKADNADVRSYLQLIEIDCAESRFRNVAAKTYAGYFGEGRQLFNGSRLDPWTYEFASHPTIFFGCLVLKMP